MSHIDVFKRYEYKYLLDVSSKASTVRPRLSLPRGVDQPASAISSRWICAAVSSRVASS